MAMDVACSECNASSTQVIRCPHCTDDFHYLRAHGWWKPSRSKNWYCTSCVVRFNWLDADHRSKMTASLGWLCSPACEARAVAFLQEAELRPRAEPPAGASSSSGAPAGASSSSNAPAGASSDAQTQSEIARAWSIAEALTSLGSAITPVRMFAARPSEHHGDVPLHFMCPVTIQALEAMNPTGRYMLQRYSEEDVTDLVVQRPPVVAVRRRALDLRGVMVIGERQFKKRKQTHDLDTKGSSDGVDADVPFIQAGERIYPTLGEDHDEDPVYRVCTTSSVLRAASLSGDSTRNSLQLSIATWNGGAFRGFRVQEAFRGGQYHILLGQEFASPGKNRREAQDPQQADRARQLHEENLEQQAALDRMGFSSLCEGYQLVAANKSSVATLAPLVHLSQPAYEALFAEVTFRYAHSGLTKLVVGSLHLDHEKSKKAVLTAEALLEWAEAAETWQVDVVGCDWNRGQQVLEMIMQRQKGGMIIHTGDKDCTGFLVPGWSKLRRDNMPDPRASYFNVPVTDLGWGVRDADSHWMVAAHWRRNTNLRQRTAEAAAERKKRGDAARKAKKRAAAATEPGAAAISASAGALEQPAASSALATAVEVQEPEATAAPVEETTEQSAAAAAQAPAAIQQACR